MEQQSCWRSVIQVLRGQPKKKRNGSAVPCLVDCVKRENHLPVESRDLKFQGLHRWVPPPDHEEHLPEHPHRRRRLLHLGTAGRELSATQTCARLFPFFRGQSCGLSSLREILHHRLRLLGPVPLLGRLLSCTMSISRPFSIRLSTLVSDRVCLALGVFKCVKLHVAMRGLLVDLLFGNGRLASPPSCLRSQPSPLPPILPRWRSLPSRF